LLPLTEAISGQGLNKQGMLEMTTTNRFEVLEQIRKKLNSQLDNDDWVRWGRWFLADPATRTISPSSEMTVRDYIDDQIKQQTATSLDEAKNLAVGNTNLLERISKARVAFVIAKSPN
jgi:hypothetical protein